MTAEIREFVEIRAMTVRAHPRRLLHALLIAAAALTSQAAPKPSQVRPTPVTEPSAAGIAAPTGWIDVDYAALVDARRLSHSGESVGMLLQRLGGRPVPRPGERPEDTV